MPHEFEQRDRRPPEPPSDKKWGKKRRINERVGRWVAPKRWR